MTAGSPGTAGRGFRPDGTSGNADGAAVAARAPSASSGGEKADGDPDAAQGSSEGRSDRWSLTEIQARSLIAGLALITAAVFAAWIWGVPGTLAVILAGQLYLLGSRVVDYDRNEQLSDDVDQNRSGLDDVKNHLWGLEPAGAGKHAKGRLG